MDNGNRSTRSFSKMAESGQRAATLLATVGSDRMFMELSASISVSATLILEITGELEDKPQYFKPMFEEKFGRFIHECSARYDKVLAALDKMDSLNSEDASKDYASTRTEKFLSALGIKQRDLRGFMKEWKKSFDQLRMMHSVVMLIVLESRAKDRDLTPSEKVKLLRLRKAQMKLLQSLRDAEIADVVIFSLKEMTPPSCLIQVENDRESVSGDDGSSTAASTVTHNSSSRDSAISAKQGLNYPPPPPPPIITIHDNDIFEVYQADIKLPIYLSKQHIYRLCGIPLKAFVYSPEPEPIFEELSTSQEDIKAMLEDLKKDPNSTVPTPLQALLKFPVDTNAAITTLLKGKNGRRGPQELQFKWTVECLTTRLQPAQPAQQISFPKRLWKSKTSQGLGTYILILRGKQQVVRPSPPPPPPQGWNPRGPPYPPPPPGWIPRGPPGPPSPPRPVPRFIQPRKIKEKTNVATIKLTQRETEIVINDFLASVSTLYDGVPIEQRGVLLKGLRWDGQSDDFDSDECSSDDSDDD